MPALRATETHAGRLRPPRGLLVLAMALAAASPALPEGRSIEVTRVEAHLGDGIWQIDADLSTELDPRAVDALTHGVPLTLLLEVRLDPPARWYWPWPEPLAAVEEPYLIHQHALSGQFIVQRLSSGKRSIHRDVEEAVAGIGSVRNLPLVAARSVSAGQRYEGRLRLSLDIEALPAPMQPLAWLTWGRRLGSRWFRWDFIP